jgi:aspartate kinase
MFLNWCIQIKIFRILIGKKMKIFKFGGVSINSIERFKNTGNIIQSFEGDKILIVVSAMGKTTNALEKIVTAFFEGNKTDALLLFQQLKNNHLEYIKYLTVSNWQKAEEALNDFFTEIEWLLHDKPVRSYDYYYDQIVSCGELLSSSILASHLMDEKQNPIWLDVRDIVRTDKNYRNANIDWAFTEKRIMESVIPLFEHHDIVITQGFIGCTDENENTTLGREGSDYSAAVFANLLNADSVTIWKDVDAVMSADPKKFPNATAIHTLSYNEVIEMAYYGAQVIHPKTIKPLQNKGIPLFVKSFLNPEAVGTVINTALCKNLPPIIVQKEKQVLIQFKTLDFSFIEEKTIEKLYDLFDDLKLNPVVTQKTAISLWAVFDDVVDKIDDLASNASAFFDVELERNLSLITIRHYLKETVDELAKDKVILLEQKTISTIQMLMR